MLGRQQHFLNDLDENEFDEVIEIMSNAHLNNNFLNLARELDIMDAKTPDDVYKSHLDNVRPVFGGGIIFYFFDLMSHLPPLASKFRHSKQMPFL